MLLAMQPKYGFESAEARVTQSGISANTGRSNCVNGTRAKAIDLIFGRRMIGITIRRYQLRLANSSLR
jgi:hypothetical protein